MIYYKRVKCAVNFLEKDVITVYSRITLLLFSAYLAAQKLFGLSVRDIVHSKSSGQIDLHGISFIYYSEPALNLGQVATIV